MGEGAPGYVPDNIKNDADQEVVRDSISSFRERVRGEVPAQPVKPTLLDKIRETGSRMAGRYTRHWNGAFDRPVSRSNNGNSTLPVFRETGEIPAAELVARRDKELRDRGSATSELDNPK